MWDHISTLSPYLNGLPEQVEGVGVYHVPQRYWLPLTLVEFCTGLLNSICSITCRFTRGTIGFAALQRLICMLVLCSFISKAFGQIVWMLRGDEWWTPQRPSTRALFLLVDAQSFAILIASV